MKTKDEVFNRFQEYKALVENATSKRIRTLWSNNEGEYTSKEFQEFCTKVEIRREWTIPYNPPQNEVAERKNRSISKATRAMLYGQELKCYLWAEACSTVVYIQNRVTHRALGKMSPMEAFNEKKPHANHFCIFGCLVYSRIPRDTFKVGSDCKVRLFCWVQQNLKGIQDFHPRGQEDYSHARCHVHGGQGVQKIQTDASSKRSK